MNLPKCTAELFRIGCEASMVPKATRRSKTRLHWKQKSAFFAVIVEPKANAAEVLNLLRAGAEELGSYVGKRFANGKFRVWQSLRMDGVRYLTIGWWDKQEESK